MKMILGSQTLCNILVTGSCEVICVFGAPAKGQVRNAANSLLVCCSINSITSLKWVRGESGRYSRAKTTHSAMLHSFLEPSSLYHQGLKNKKTDSPTQELKKSSESRPHYHFFISSHLPKSLIEFLHLIYVFLVSSSFVFFFFLPLNSFPSRFTTCDYASMQTCPVTFNNRGAPLTELLIKVVEKVLSGVCSAEKASPGITIRYVPGPSCNYTFSTSLIHLPFRGKL